MALASVKMFRTAGIILTELNVPIKNNGRFALRLCRAKHTYVTLQSPFGCNTRFLRIKRDSPIAAIGAVRYASQGPIVIDEATLPPIPVPPSVPVDTTITETITEVIEQVAKEPSIASYGLGKWTPVGLVQNGLEYFHITLDLPWWGSIVLGTVILRTLVFPLVVLSQRNAARMSNNLPQLQRIQEKMTEARQSGNNFEAARLAQEMMLFMKEKQLSPLKNFIPPLVQAPAFISMFMGLRGMANVPVESLRTGGMLWFTDLTLPDQYYLLPLVTSVTLAATIELGTDSARASTMGMVRYVLRALPFVIFPFTINFPGAVLCYWVSTNFISLVQVGILRIPRIREYFKIDKIVVHPKDALAQKKGFVKGFKESMSNMKITRELQDREHVDAINFERAGRAPIQRTFKYDPTKVRPAATTSELLAKKKER